ncbi:MAG: UDP-galactopyranose mutase [Bacilli bacterium]|jgi:UDP-galactopyranose mutase
MYDYLIVGAGLFGATFANLCKKRGLKVLVIDKKPVTAGALLTERRDNIDIHIYGPHIFHTSDKEVWDYFSSFGEMNNFVNAPLAFYKGKLYHMPFNMNTFNALWGVITPEEAKAKIAEQVQACNITQVTNLEEQALSLVGSDVFNTLIKGYTEKQWGRDCKDLPSSIIKRLPLRFTYNNNYFNDRYQGIPVDGYSSIIDKMLDGIEVKLNTDYLSNKDELKAQAKRIIYTGEIDRYYAYCFGPLAYRTLRFETDRKEVDNYQGNAVINYTEREVPYTRVIEHKWFNFRESPVTYITREYPKEFKPGDDPFYPVNNPENASLYAKYLELSKNEKEVFFCGRLGQYKYFDMDDTISEAMKLFKDLEG